MSCAGNYVSLHMPQEILGYRYRRHRATGMPAGPLTPVFKADWPYKLPPRSQIVWRYLDLWKFEDMCRSSSLYFRRCDKFPDPLEGRLSKRGIHGTSESDRAFAAAYRNGQDYDAQTSAQEVTRSCMFVNCWHMNTQESDRMWREYAPNSESIVITSSVKALQRTIPQGEVMISAVHYVAEDVPRTEFDHSSICFYKDNSFDYERELRLLQPLHGGDNVSVDREEDFGRSIPVNLRLLIHRVILNKRISSSARQSVTDLVRQYCRRATMQESNL